MSNKLTKVTLDVNILRKANLRWIHMLLWLIQNIGEENEDWMVISDGSQTIELGFKHSTDAVAVKLRWA